MSEPFSKPRGYPAALDVRASEGQVVSGDKADPLTELARLVGRDDPFRDLFPARPPASPQVRSDRAPTEPTSPTPYDPFDRQTAPPQPRTTSGFGDALAAEGQPDVRHSDDDDSTFHAPLGQARRDAFRLPTLPDETDPIDPHEAPSDYSAALHKAPALNADLWAQGMSEPVSADPMRFASSVDDAEASAGDARRRTLVVVLAVLALTAGGIGATFLVRGGASDLAASSAPPTIMADNAPTKVQPPDTSNQSTGGDGTTALIEKSASDNVSNAKLTDSQERPVDLDQLPKAPVASAAPSSDDGRVAVTTAPAGTNASSLPEPRKVKTVVIRPDGSVVGADGPAAVSEAPAGSGAAAASADGALPAETAARPATPKVPTRTTATPKSASVSTDNTAAAKPKVPRTPPKPKPAQTAAAEPTPDVTASTTPAAGAALAPGMTGDFAVQLAAPATDQEARDISGRLQQKFASQLDGYTPSIRKAEKGDKAVYRVRVGNLSQDDAKSLCAKLKSAGGSCFVVHN